MIYEESRFPTTARSWRNANDTNIQIMNETLSLLVVPLWRVNYLEIISVVQSFYPFNSSAGPAVHSTTEKS